jgi:hypothetical protein
MKIKIDFVTNSSSTSFILITDDGFSKQEFLKQLGVHKDSKFKFIFEELFDAIENNKKPLRNYCLEYEDISNFKDYIKINYSKDMLDKILKAESTGKSVYLGRLSSDSGEIEAFFCTDSFEIETESFYFNSINCSW